MVITVFVAIIGASVALIGVLYNYERVLSRAKEEEMLPIIRATIMYPAVTAGTGIIYTFLTDNISFGQRISIGPEALEFVNLVQNSIIVLLVAYSVISLLEGISFIRRVMVGESSSTTTRD